MSEAASFNNTIAIVRACVNAGRADLIEDALFARQDVAEVQAKIERERAPQPAAAAATAPANRSIFGEPSPAERDKLAVALQRRFEQVYPKRAP
jgi:hypothetical protein